MITNNLKNLITLYLSRNDSGAASFTYYYLDIDGNKKSFTGSRINISSCYSTASFTGSDPSLSLDMDTSKYPTDMGKGCILVGTSDAEEKAEDYNLALVDSSLLQHVTATYSTTTDTNCATWLTMSRTFRYIGTEELTIKECGLFSFVYNDARYQDTISQLISNNNATKTKILMARSVLKEPITVSTNQVFTVTMTLQL